jgi:O-acetyl-ADP-ribose deacetylase
MARNPSILRSADHRPAGHRRGEGAEGLKFELEVVEGDITSLAVDAIANAANDHLWMGAGVAGAIKRAGGDDIEREAVALGPIEVGDAVATSAGRLHARYVIHGAVMGQDLRTNAGLIERTTRRCLEVADELGLECARIMVGTARGYDAKSLRRAVFAVFGVDAKQAFDAALDT